MKALVPWLWRALFALSALNYADTTALIGAGGFEQSGLHPAMLDMERVGNALQSVGWALVLVLSFRRDPLIAPELCLFLSGMLFFDVQTTWPLNMPLPPYFAVWGTLIAFVQAAGYFHLAARRAEVARAAPSFLGLPLAAIYALTGASAVSFALSAYALSTGVFDGSGLAAETLPLHVWVNGLEAVGWGGAIALTAVGRVRPAAALAVFLAGMWAWDHLTTMNLSMPVPPLQIIWGTLSVALMLLGAHEIHSRGGARTGIAP